jgi:hypothetical protein
VNSSFQKFLALPEQDRQDVFEASAQELDTRSSYIEKDFWVCLVLDILYNGLSGDHPRLLFRGGTSLSKGYGLIRRFSEDVDFTVDIQDLGFSGDQDPLSPELSKNKRKSLSKQIRRTTSAYICDRLKADLSEVALKTASGCQVLVDPDDSDLSTLLFLYPSLVTQDAYVQPRVKLEGGGRAALEPCEERQIQPYIADTLEDWDFTVKNVTMIQPHRTFWDKVYILHGWYCGYRDQQRLPDDRQRLSRHYYDLAMISRTKIGQQAIADATLREDVRTHTRLFFHGSWRKLEEAIPGSIHLLPTELFANSLKQDYQAMQGMMLGGAPDFEQILADLSKLEEVINQ